MYTFGEGDLSSGVHVVILGVQNQVKGKSQAGGLGTGCRSRGPNQDKSLLFAFAFSEIYFPLLQVIYLFNLILLF